MGFNTFRLTDCKIVVHGFVERIGEFPHALALKINKPVDTLYLTKEDTIGFTESYRAKVSFILKCIHIKFSCFK